MNVARRRIIKSTESYEARVGVKWSGSEEKTVYYTGEKVVEGWVDI
jgi:hypothetical protein